MSKLKSRLFTKKQLKQESFIKTLNKQHHFLDVAHKHRFFIQLIASYFYLIVVCIFCMSVFSYSIINVSIKDESLKSNDRILAQLKSTVDSLLLSKMSDVSMAVLQDCLTNPSMYYYFSGNMKKNITCMVDVMDYCENLKSLNPLIYSAGIYYERNQLLISSEGVKSPNYGRMANENYYSYYKSLLSRSSEPLFWSTTPDYNRFTSQTEAESSFNVRQSTKTNVIHLVRRVQIDGMPVGAIIITLDEQIFFNSVRKTAFETLDKILICDENGMIISHTDKDMIGRNIGVLEFGKNILSSQSFPGSEILKVDSVQSAVSYDSSDCNNWKYVAITPLDKFNQIAQNLIRTMIFVAAVVILFGILLAIIPSSKFSHPITDLVQFCRQLNRVPRSESHNEYSYVQSTLEGLSVDFAGEKKRFEEILPTLKEMVLRELLTEPHIDVQELEDKMRLMEFKFPFPLFCGLSLRCDKKAGADADNHTGLKMIASALNQVFEGTHGMNFHLSEADSVKALINFDMSVSELQAALSAVVSAGPVGLHIGVGAVTSSLADISVSFAHSSEALTYRYIFPQQDILYSEKTIELNDDAPQQLQASLVSLKSAVAAHDENRVGEELHRLIETVKTEPCSLQSATDALQSSVAILTEAANSLDISLDGYSQEEIQNKLKGHASIIDFEAWVFGLVTKLFEAVSNLHSDVNSEMVQKSKEYIIENIKDSRLSLQAVAQNLYISPSHLSKIFKSETGGTFIDYVINLKLEYCRNLLLTTTMKIEDVSESMCYSTPQYFISRFKMTYGFTPKEYRRKFAQKQP